MGNSQSKSNARGRIYKITHKFSFSNLTCKQILENRERMRKEGEKWRNINIINVDSTIEQFEEIMKKQINFVLDNGEIQKNAVCPNLHPFTSYQVGDYVRVGFGVTLKDDEFSLNIEDSDDMERVGRPDSEGNIRDSNGEFIEFLKGTNEYFSTMVQGGYRLEAYQTQAWTSYNLPPK